MEDVMRRFLFAASAALAALLVGPAGAADLPPRYKALPIQLYNWTGCYFGAQLGEAWARQDWTDRTSGSPAFGRPYGDLVAQGFVGGVQGGCDYQTGPFVFGVRGDFLWANARGSNDNLVTATLLDRSRVKSLASVTGRVGYAWDRLLTYVKGGGAWQRIEYDFFIPATSATLSAARETHGGWTVGIGAEYAFLPNVSVFVEYDYFDFGTRSNQFVTVLSVLDRNADIRERTSVVKGGVNFRFDLASTAIRY
jgi:outer membrane immunogenic protein